MDRSSIRAATDPPPVRLGPAPPRRLSASADSDHETAAARPDTPPEESKDARMLVALKAEFESFRSLLTCKICYGLLYEPFTTGCGHTYCYSCLHKSFVRNQPKQCPECRSPLFQAPAPSYLIKEMTHSLVKRAELLPSDESVEQHAEMQKEHAEMVQSDKRAAGQWFKGHFSRPQYERTFNTFASRLPTHLRNGHPSGSCPRCTWLLLNGECYQCGFPGVEADEQGTAETDDGSEELDADIDMFDMDDGLDDGVSNASWEEYDGPYGDFPIEEDEEPYENITRYLTSIGEQNIRGAPHSAAGGRRRQYTPSVSDYQDTDMILEEDEDEDEDEDGESSSMATDDQVTDASQESEFGDVTESGHSVYGSARSTVADPPAPSTPSRRRPRADSSEQASSIGQPNSRRRRIGGQTSQRSPVSTQAPANRMRRQLPSTSDIDLSSSSTSTTTRQQRLQLPDVWSDPRQAMVLPEGRILRILDDDMAEGDDSSDGGRTAVEFENTSRARANRSVTPTAPQPPTQGRAGQRPNSRPLRSRGSVISINELHYDDNDADVEDGDQGLGYNRPLRMRNSRIFRPLPEATNPPPVPSSPSSPRSASSTQSPAQNPESSSATRRVRMVDQLGPPARQESTQDGPSRAMNRTPLARPRTSNRNRSAAVPNEAPSQRLAQTNPRSRTPQLGAYMQARATTPRAEQPASPLASRTYGHVAPVRPSSRNQGANRINQQIEHAIGQIDTFINPRPPSAAGRRNAVTAHVGPGLNTAQNSQSRNPFLISRRTSTRALRNEPSVLHLARAPSNRNLRTRQSRTNVRGTVTSPTQHRAQIRHHDTLNPEQSLHPSPSRMHLPQPNRARGLDPTSPGTQFRSVTSNVPLAAQQAMERRRLELEQRRRGREYALEQLRSPVMRTHAPGPERFAAVRPPPPLAETIASRASIAGSSASAPVAAMIANPGNPFVRGASQPAPAAQARYIPPRDAWSSGEAPQLTSPSTSSSSSGASRPSSLAASSTASLSTGQLSSPNGSSPSQHGGVERAQDNAGNTSTGSAVASRPAPQGGRNVNLTYEQMREELQRRGYNTQTSREDQAEERRPVQTGHLVRQQAHQQANEEAHFRHLVGIQQHLRGLQQAQAQALHSDQRHQQRQPTMQPPRSYNEYVSPRPEPSAFVPASTLHGGTRGGGAASLAVGARPRGAPQIGIVEVLGIIRQPGDERRYGGAAGGAPRGH